jgi:hypothetical protein
MQKKVTTQLLMLLLSVFMMFSQTQPTPANPPASTDKPACSCCAGHDMSKCKDMAACKGKDCCKDGKCTADCPMMKGDKSAGGAGMMCGDKMAGDKSMAGMDCCKDGKCTDKCPMNKDGKAMSCADCCKDNKCPMMNQDDKNKSSADMKDMKGCCGGNKCSAPAAKSGN